MRLALLFAVGTALLIGVGGAVFTDRLGAALHRSTIATLQARVALLAQNLPEAGSGTNFQDPATPLVAGLAARDEAVAQILTPTGRVLQASGPGSGTPLLSAAQLSAAKRGPLVFERRLGVPAGPLLLLAQSPAGSAGEVVVAGTSLDTLDQAVGQVTGALFVGGPLAVVLAGLSAWLLSGAALRPVERMRRQAADISGRDCGATLVVPNTRDEVAGLARTLNDMLGRLEGALSRQRGFVTAAGHELRTPLSILKAGLELASRPNRTRDELVAAIREASEETERLVRLAEELLLLARVDEGSPLVSKNPADVMAVVGEALAAFAIPAARARVGLSSVGPDTLFAPVDAFRLRQVLDNLIDNAVRFATPDTTVEVVTCTRDGHVLLEVADAGPGFPPQFLPRAFDRFARADDERGRADGGLGLGLAIAKSLVEAHGGRIEAANRPAGGAIVRVLVPLGTDRAPEPVPGQGLGPSRLTI